MARKANALRVAEAKLFGAICRLYSLPGDAETIEHIAELSSVVTELGGNPEETKAMVALSMDERKRRN